MPPTVTNLREAKHSVQHQKGMLDLGPHAGLVAIARAFPFRERTVTMRLALRGVPSRSRVPPDHFFLATVCGVSPHPGLLAMWQLTEHTWLSWTLGGVAATA